MHVAWAPPRVVCGRRDCLSGAFLVVHGDFGDLLGSAKPCHLVPYILKKWSFPGASQVRNLSVRGARRCRVAWSAYCAHLVCILAV